MVCPLIPAGTSVYCDQQGPRCGVSTDSSRDLGVLCPLTLVHVMAPRISRDLGVVCSLIPAGTSMYCDQQGPRCGVSTHSGPRHGTAGQQGPRSVRQDDAVDDRSIVRLRWSDVWQLHRQTTTHQHVTPLATTVIPLYHTFFLFACFDTEEVPRVLLSFQYITRAPYVTVRLS